MVAHTNRVLTRSAARTLVRLSAAIIITLVACGTFLNRREPAADSAAGAGYSASFVSGTAAWAMVTGGATGSGRVKPASGREAAVAFIGGSGVEPGALSLQERQATSALESLNMSACMGQGDLDVPMTQAAFLAQTPARLRLEHVRFSPYKSPVSVTLVTTYDISRLHMLDGLCSSWGGHVSAAVYQGLTDPSERANTVQWAKYRIDDVWKRARQRKACALDIALWSELLAADDTWMPMLFPVNSLRSRALLLARTSLILVLDGDMLVHSGLHRALAAQPARYGQLLSEAQQKRYRVLAAFQAPDLDVAYDVAEGSKAHTVEMFRQKTIVRFNPEHAYPQGCTDYELWPAAQEPYSITYCKRYEPWGIVSRQLMPWFDVRFRGYGRNKIVFAAALNSSDFSFVVDDASFVIHRPHEASKGSIAFSSDAKLQGHVVRMYSEQARAGRFTPVVDEALKRCKAQLPWWD